MKKRGITLMWIAREAALAFSKAMRSRRLVLRDAIDTDALVLRIDIVRSADIDEMRGRAVMAGRMLADLARQERIRSFAPIALPFAGESAQAQSKKHGVALRVTPPYTAHIDGYLRLEMRGSRYVRKRAHA